MIAIESLSPTVERRLIAARQNRDRQAERVASRVCEDVRRTGDRALFAYTARFDRARLRPVDVWIPASEFERARQAVSAGFRREMAHAARNIRAVARAQLPRTWKVQVEPGVVIGQTLRPLDSVGCYIPGGRASLVSTLLMTVIPAQVAGVPRIVVCCPKPNDYVLAAADFLGVREVARIGGAQAIAAMAYGTQTVPRVEKIVGPGNRFVTAAKRLVNGDSAIDFLAGPTEVLIVAERGNPRFIAADLLAQAEHDPDAIALFVTPSRKLAEAVRTEVSLQLPALPGGNPAAHALRTNSAILVTRTLSDAAEFANRFAPEHLSLPGGARKLLPRIRSAGTVFLGDWSTQPVGDFAGGSNHVLPTSGGASARSGLSAADFVKCVTTQDVSRRGLARLAPIIREFGKAEGLPAHAGAVMVRLS